MKRKFRLTRSTDFERVRREGKAYVHPLLVLVAAPNQMNLTRIGVVAGKSVGCAVNRNRAKRLIRAGVQELSTKLTSGWDIIFFSKKSLYQVNFPEICGAIRSTLSKAGIIEQDG